MVRNSKEKNIRRFVVMSYREKCMNCKYNISCNYYQPFCDLAEMPIESENDCPLKKETPPSELLGDNKKC